MTLKETTDPGLHVFKSWIRIRAKIVQIRNTGQKDLQPVYWIRIRNLRITDPARSFGYLRIYKLFQVLILQICCNSALCGIARRRD
jgi:hypothetical protein